MGQRYFFDFAAEGGITKDEEGSVLANDTEARREAIAALAGLFRDELIGQRGESEDRKLRCTVLGEDGRLVYAAELSFKGMWPV